MESAIQTNTINNKNMTQSSPTNIIYGNAGVVNTGNTCYMNSAIQAFSHLNPLTYYFFHNKDIIINILKNNARKIFSKNKLFQIQGQSIIPIELRQKIQDPNYNANMLTNNDMVYVLNATMTFQLIKLLEQMWRKNCVVMPTSFRKIFSEVRNKFFFGYEQHDAEEAYSCILQQVQEELAEVKIVKFNTTRPSVKEFLVFKNEIADKIAATNDRAEQQKLMEIYLQKKKQMPEESLIIEACKEMKKYYGTAYSRVTEIFTGFLHSSTNCDNPQCGFASNKFDPFLHLSLPMPTISQAFRMNRGLTINDCLDEYCKTEILDDNNLWECEGCKTKVRAIKKLQLWSCPPILVIQFKRFGMMRTTKDNRLVSYPLTNFDVSSLVSPVQYDKTKCYTYRLLSVVNHYGGLHGGHYYTYCKDEDTGRWFNYNDDQVSEIKNSQVITNTAYILFFLREDMLSKP